jgi:hypothetical protein
MGDQAYRDQRAVIRQHAPKAQDFLNRRYGETNSQSRSRSGDGGCVRADASEQPPASPRPRPQWTVLAKASTLRIHPEKRRRPSASRHTSARGQDCPRRGSRSVECCLRGSVAVTGDGRRCGKGEGYSDLEFAVLRELGHLPVPAATTVHDLQIVDFVPRDPTDQLG